MTRHQPQLYGYIRSLAPGIEADDILQETNITLWEKADTFEHGTNFKAFAFRVAYLKTLEALRRHRRQGWLTFDDSLLEKIADRNSNAGDGVTEHLQSALGACLAELRREERTLIAARYAERHTVRAIAASIGKSEGALQQLFFRIRTRLRACIEHRIATGKGLEA